MFVYIVHMAHIHMLTGSHPHAGWLASIYMPAGSHLSTCRSHLSTCWLAHIYLRAGWLTSIYMPAGSHLSTCRLAHIYLHADWLTSIYMLAGSHLSTCWLAHIYLHAGWLTSIYMLAGSPLSTCRLAHIYLHAGWLTSIYMPAGSHLSTCRLAHIYLHAGWLTSIYMPAGSHLSTCRLAHRSLDFSDDSVHVLDNKVNIRNYTSYIYFSQYSWWHNFNCGHPGDGDDNENANCYPKFSLCFSLCLLDVDNCIILLEHGMFKCIAPERIEYSTTSYCLLLLFLSLM